jgi:NSS family neurotransmitter:Na+ symporter
MSKSQFSSNWGFIWAAVGSAVGLGNVWSFPFRVGAYGGSSGGAFLLVSLIFMVIFTYCGLPAEYSAGRRAKTGTLGAYEKVWKDRGWGKAGKMIGWLPLMGSLAIAIGYSVIISYLLKALFDSITGTLMSVNISAWFSSFAERGMSDFIAGGGKYTSSVIFANYTVMPFHIIVIIFSLATLLLAAASIEKTNKIIMPLFYILFIILIIRVLFMPGMSEGYKFIFTIDPKAFLNPMMYVMAAGQAFFSLSITGSGMIVYGAYLGDKEDVVKCAKYTGTFAFSASLIAMFVIIPACFVFQVPVDGGPNLLFVTLPNIFQQLPAGQLLAILFFIAMFFSGVTSIQNMFEAVVESLLKKLPKLNRKAMLGILAILTFSISVHMQTVYKWGPWMDIITIYIIPIGAIIGAVSWFWIMKKEDLLDEINKGSKHVYKDIWYNIGKYVYVPIALIICILAFVIKGV